MTDDTAEVAAVADDYAEHFIAKKQERHGEGWRPATPLDPPHGGLEATYDPEHPELLIGFQPADGGEPEVYPVSGVRPATARVYCTKHRIARCTVCTGTSNADLVSRIAFRPEDAVVARTNDRLASRRGEFDAAVRYVFSLRLASWLLAGVLEELVWDYDAQLAKIGRGDLS